MELAGKMKNMEKTGRRASVEALANMQPAQGRPYSYAEGGILIKNYREICIRCKSPNLQPAGTCKVCADCGETTGCS